MLGEVYPHNVIERCVQQSQPWANKARRVRASTALSSGAVCDRHGVVEPLEPMSSVGRSRWASSAMLHPAEPESALSDAALSGRRQALGSQCLQALMRERRQPRPAPQHAQCLLWSLSAHGH